VQKQEHHNLIIYLTIPSFLQKLYLCDTALNICLSGKAEPLL